MGEIKMDVQRMVKRRKDNGFTLIELMIVIAIIGILAVVLVPRVGNVKTQARSAGIDTNIRMVEGYVQSRITSWNNANTPTADLVTDITNAMTTGADPMVNPLGGATRITVSAAAAPDTAVAGQIYVTVTAGADPITIDAYDSNRNRMTDKTVTVNP
ncbi:competence type IV pilus major pilin ComGC [Desulfitobacterium sp. Sab5]|uniref:competence type IV pilus major pilin ComGC n=1 Tax=Desulfitobacterium nosdiversum TaxID=3375356 RepID=UPI003CF3F45C